MSVQRIVLVDCFMDELAPYGDDYAIVAVDVIRSTTTAVTAVSTGRRCFPVPTVEAALHLSTVLPNALLVGEQGGGMPYGFAFTNSPFEMHRRDYDLSRPAVLLSSSGTKLLCAAAERHANVYAACLRNARATAVWVAAHHSKVAVVGAGTRGEFREEDQLACAWIASALVAEGFAADARTAALIESGQGLSAHAIDAGKSAAYLRRSGQSTDLHFVLSHVNDLDLVCTLQNDEIVVPDRALRQEVAA